MGIILADARASAYIVITRLNKDLLLEANPNLRPVEPFVYAIRTILLYNPKWAVVHNEWSKQNRGSYRHLHVISAVITRIVKIDANNTF